MANLLHLRTLKLGMKRWNTWHLKNYMTVADLTGADLTGTDFRGYDLYNVNLTGAKLSGANLCQVRLFGADLRATDLRKANLSMADLYGTQLNEADLRATDLISTDFRKTNVSEADLSHSMIGATRFDDVDLGHVKGLETVQHRGPSTIGIDTIYKSKGKIPEVFLRGAGVPESFITFMHSLVATAFEFYSCFISHSSKDQEFAERLYADLQSRGVRCWFAPEDLKIGDPFRQRIDEAIRLHDKLMIVLSKDSVNSPWVEKEVETAFEKERRQNRMVLFPIRLDNAVIQTDQAWASDIRRTRHLGDFRDWKNHESYKKAFDRLLRDLRAETRA